MSGPQTHVLTSAEKKMPPIYKVKCRWWRRRRGVGGHNFNISLGPRSCLGSQRGHSAITACRLNCQLRCARACVCVCVCRRWEDAACWWRIWSTFKMLNFFFLLLVGFPLDVESDFLLKGPVADESQTGRSTEESPLACRRRSITRGPPPTNTLFNLLRKGLINMLIPADISSLWLTEERKDGIVVQ